MSSKYDRVKVKVILDEQHYYILSRFLFSKMLCMCRIPETDAVRVSLGIKKYFVDQEKLDITQAELGEAALKIMSQYGYGDSCKRLFPVISRLYLNRIPLIIFIAGSGCCGKTAIAYSLSSKLSTHVVSTEMLMDIFVSVHDTFSPMDKAITQNFSSSRPPPDDRGFWLHETETEYNFVELWRNWAKCVHPLVEAELDKAVSEGKVLIIEGSLLDLSLYCRYLSKDFQVQHAAIVVAFFATAGDVSRQYTVERFLSTRSHLLPPGIAEDSSAAALWMMRRIKAIEREQMDTLSQHASIRLYPIDEEGVEKSSELTDLPKRELLAPYDSQSKFIAFDDEKRKQEEQEVRKRENNCNKKENKDMLEADETFRVHVANYSVADPTKLHEAMHEVVLENILNAILQREMAS